MAGKSERERYRYFLKDTIRQKIDFSQTEQSLGRYAGLQMLGLADARELLAGRQIYGAGVADCRAHRHRGGGACDHPPDDRRVLETVVSGAVAAIL